MIPTDGTQSANNVTTVYAGNCTTSTDEAGTARKSCVDGLGRLTGVWEHPNGKDYETDYAYNALGDLMSVTQKGSSSASARVRTFTYDSLSRLMCAANPEIQSVTCPALATGTLPAGATIYGYDSDSNLISKTSPAPNQSSASVTVTVNYKYDALNRLTKKTYTGMTMPTIQYGYDGKALQNCTTTPPSLTDPNQVGRRTAMCDGSGATSWSHDPMGSILQESRTIGSATGKNTTYTYNLNESLATLTTPPQKQITYTPGGAGRPLSAVDTGDGVNFVTSAYYAPFGGLTGMTMGSTSSFAGISTSDVYSVRLQPVQLYASSPTGTIFSECNDFHLGVSTTTPYCSFTASTLGNNGNVYQITNNRNTTRTESFTYDSLNRITSGQSSGSQWGENYTIDAWGNLYARSGVSGKTNYEPLSTVAPGTNNQLSSYTYDAAGNMTVNGSTSYVYDAENRLLWTSGYGYVYDGDGERVEKCVASTSSTPCPTSGTNGTLYWRGTGSDTLSESDLSGNALEDYVFFLGQRVARRDVSTDAVHFYFSDHLGTHAVIENATGTACEQDADYYPYGGEENDYCTTPVAQNYKFTGKERDAESGLDYFGFRHYAPSLGRFMKPDEPFADQDEANPQSWNLYSYVRNNPLRYIDPTGNACVSDGNGGWKDDNSGGETCAQVNAANQNAQPSVTVTATAPPNVALAAGAATLELGWEGGPPDWAVGLGLLGLGCVQTHCWTPIINLFSQTGNNSPPPATSPSTSQTATPNPDNGGGRKWKFGSNKSEQQWRSNLARRGWTPEQIDEAVANGQKFPAQNNINPSNGATRYVNPTTGRSVVLDNVTNEVIHVGGDGFRY